MLSSNKEHYVYDHEKYGENKSVGSASGVYKSAAVACDSAIGSAVGKYISTTTLFIIPLKLNDYVYHVII